MMGEKRAKGRVGVWELERTMNERGCSPSPPFRSLPPSMLLSSHVELVIDAREILTCDYRTIEAVGTPRSSGGLVRSCLAGTLASRSRPTHQSVSH